MVIQILGLSSLRNLIEFLPAECRGFVFCTEQPVPEVPQGGSKMEIVNKESCHVALQFEFDPADSRGALSLQHGDERFLFLFGGYASVLSDQFPHGMIPTER